MSVRREPGGPAINTSRSTILDAIRTLGETSRVEIAQATGFTQATVTHAVRALLAEGLVVETGAHSSTRGKPRVLLRLATTSLYAAGIQLSADWAILSVVDAAGSLVALQRVPGARGADPDAAARALRGHLDRLLQAAGVPFASLVGLGLVLPGTLDLENGTLLHSAALPDWAGANVLAAFERATDVPLLLATDATAAAAGELWRGEVGASRAHGTVYLGSTLGVGLVLDGQLYQGATSNAGGLGRVLTATSTAPVPITELASPFAVSVAARRDIANADTSVELDPDSDPSTDFATIAAAAVRGDAFARGLIIDAANHLATALMTVVDLLDLDTLTLAGPSLSVAGSIYLTTVRDRLDAEALQAGRPRINVRLSMQVADAAAVGAATMVLRRTLSALAEGSPWHRPPPSREAGETPSRTARPEH
ncbi:ROK family transcriptional regulator [Cellulosimicrobium cellulans]|uniref:ROK family transcriptional regulator n=1 Tax=Cellulosimicrobium cellulans TaxID=1710 RepID=UPI0028A68EF5|nr:ROK family transcriptional regulator [Cellulosimicrobium cellulans]